MAVLIDAVHNFDNLRLWAILLQTPGAIFRGRSCQNLQLSGVQRFCVPLTIPYLSTTPCHPALCFPGRTRLGRAAPMEPSLLSRKRTKSRPATLCAACTALVTEGDTAPPVVLGTMSHRTTLAAPSLDPTGKAFSFAQPQLRAIVRKHAALAARIQHFPTLRATMNVDCIALLEEI